MQPTNVGVWEGFVPGVGQGALYKYHIVSGDGRYRVDKADPYAFASQIRPETASRVWNLDQYVWGDGSWMSARAGKNSLDSPISIYEVHLGSWRRVPEEGNRWLTYREMAPLLADYLTRRRLHPCRAYADHGASVRRLLGLPGRSAISRPPAASELRRISCLRGLSSPARNRSDSRLGSGALSRRTRSGWAISTVHIFTSTPIPRQGEQPDWNTFVFNYGRNEGAEFSDQQRAVLAGQISRGWPSRRCRRLHAVSRLCAATRANGFRIAMAGKKISTRLSSCAR